MYMRTCAYAGIEMYIYAVCMRARSVYANIYYKYKSCLYLHTTYIYTYIYIAVQRHAGCISAYLRTYAVQRHIYAVQRHIYIYIYILRCSAIAAGCVSAYLRTYMRCSARRGRRRMPTSRLLSQLPHSSEDTSAQHTSAYVSISDVC
jgi:hypothetical protein